MTNHVCTCMAQAEELRGSLDEGRDLAAAEERAEAALRQAQARCDALGDANAELQARGTRMLRAFAVCAVWSVFCFLCSCSVRCYFYKLSAG
jgi:hypothetical protein